MKKRISITIEEDLDKKLDKILTDTRYRNKSHLVEEAIRTFLEVKK